MSTPCFQIKMAGRIIRVEPLTPYLKHFCKDYLIEDGEEADLKSDFAVSVSNKDLEYERELSREIQFPSEPSDAFFETAALHRKITEGLQNFDTVLVHASCLAIDGAGICFAAPSGVGKSTHAAYWRETFKDRVVMVNDDKPFFQVTEKGVVAYGSPWNGANHLGGNIRAPLVAFCLLKRDKKTHIEEVSAEEAYPFLLGQTQRPRNADAMRDFLPLMDRFAHQVKIFTLGCSPEPEAAQIVYEKIFALDTKEETGKESTEEVQKDEVKREIHHVQNRGKVCRGHR